MTNATTLPHLLIENARKHGSEKVALREKEFGIWQSVSWADYLANVQDLALGLVALGYEPGDKLAILADNRPEWLYSELAIQSLGGAAVGIFPDSHVDQVKYIIDHSDAVFLIVEDQEQTDKFLELKEACPKVRYVIVDDMKGMRYYDDPLLISLQKVQKMGRDLGQETPGLFEKCVAGLTEDTVAADRLHFRHDRPSQRRYADSPQHGQDGRELRSDRSRIPHRQSCFIPPVALGRRADDCGRLEPLQRLCRKFPGKD